MIKVLLFEKGNLAIAIKLFPQLCECDGGTKTFSMDCHLLGAYRSTIQPHPMLRSISCGFSKGLSHKIFYLSNIMLHSNGVWSSLFWSKGYLNPLNLKREKMVSNDGARDLEWRRHGTSNARTVAPIPGP